MDYPEALVLRWHMQLRLEWLTRNPSLIHEYAMPPVLPAPMEFAGLKSRLQRAKGLEKRAAVAGPRLDAALDVIETGVGVLETHAPELEKYGQDLMNTINGMLEPASNGGPPLVDPTSPPAAPQVQGQAAESVAPVGPNGGPRIHNPA